MRECFTWKERRSSELFSWDAILQNIDEARSEIEARERICEAAGYLRCLSDVGLVSIFQRARMDREISALRDMLPSRFPNQ